MKFVVAPDSYKGTLDQLEVAEVISNVIRTTGHDAVTKPMSDGGDGLLKCFHSKEYKTIYLPVVGTEGTSVGAEYKIREDVAIIETAQACGMHLLTGSQPGERTTYGVGEMIIHAISNGARKIILGMGGSATNDGGYGLFKALGGSATDSEGKPVLSLNKHIDLVDKIGTDSLINLDDIEMVIASDVRMPLLGEHGAVHVFGPQKNVTSDKLPIFEDRLVHFHEKMMAAGFKDYKDEAGAGAAGGLGWMLMTLGATVEAGGPLVADMIELGDAVEEADYVITGEGKSDRQTMGGKAPSIVLGWCKAYGTPCILISGQVDDDMTDVFDKVYQLVDEHHDVNTVMESTPHYLSEKVHQILRELE